MTLLILCSALALDLLFGDPPNRFHPTAWMGSLINRLWNGSTPPGKAAAFLKGAGIAVLVMAAASLPAYFLEKPVFPGKFLIEILLLKLTFSFRGLFTAARRISGSLEAGDLPEARRLLSWHLVSRDTSRLDSGGITAAALESVSENLTDSLAAPLLFYLLLGLPGAMAYRAANTCDAMLGYRDSRREWLGKFPARLDDLLNLIPARVTALMILLAGIFFSGSRGSALVMWKNRRTAPSPGLWEESWKKQVSTS